jgi:hypothetical protein
MGEETEIYPPGAYLMLGKCCAKASEFQMCTNMSKACESDGEERTICIGLYTQEGFDAICAAWCEEKTEDWCSSAPADSAGLDPDVDSSGLGAGAVAGIAVGSVAIVGAIAAVLIFFLVIKKRGDEEDVRA